MNHSVMMGRLVRDPQINYVENSKGNEMAVANFRLAVDRKFSDETTRGFQGEYSPGRKEEAVYGGCKSVDCEI